MNEQLPTSYKRCKNWPDLAVGVKSYQDKSKTLFSIYFLNLENFKMLFEIKLLDFGRNLPSGVGKQWINTATREKTPLFREKTTLFMLLLFFSSLGDICLTESLPLPGK